MLRKKIKLMVTAVLVSLNIPAFISANTMYNFNINEEILLEQALSEKSFYRYNLAYEAITKVQDQSLKEEMLSKLATLESVVWNDDIRRFNILLEDLVKTGGSGKIYDMMQREVESSLLQDIDKAYLLGELTSWGRKLVYTDDYGLAVSKIVAAWDRLNKSEQTTLSALISESEDCIAKVKNDYSKNYLLEQLQQLKDRTTYTKNIIDKFNEIRKLSSLDNEQKLAAVKELTIIDSSLLDYLPSNYLTGSDGLVFAVTFFDMNNELKAVDSTEIGQIRNSIISAVLQVETNKFKGNTFSNVKTINIKANNELYDKDITELVLQLEIPLSEGITYKPLFVSHNPSLPQRNLSEYMYVKDNKVYLKPYRFTNNFSEQLYYYVTYKGVNNRSYINIVIEP